jgi:hypothetical protein
MGTRGAGPRLSWRTPAFAALVSAVVAACGGGSPTSTATSTPTPALPTSALGDAETIWCDGHLDQVGGAALALHLYQPGPTIKVAAEDGHLVEMSLGDAMSVMTILGFNGYSEVTLRQARDIQTAWRGVDPDGYERSCLAAFRLKQ